MTSFGASEASRRNRIPGLVLTHHPGMTMATVQSFRNTIEAIQPDISAMKAVASP